MDGRQLHRLDYQPRKRKGDLKIELYFDPETYRHVRTDYRSSVPAGIGSDPAQSSGLQHTISRLTETFDNFQPVEGIMLPALWKLRLDVSNQGRAGASPHVSEMELAFQQVRHNETVDPQSFKIP